MPKDLYTLLYATANHGGQRDGLEPESALVTLDRSALATHEATAQPFVRTPR